MKIILVGDLHYNLYSSIIRRRGEFYSKRLENCINTINWIEQMAEDNYCDKIIYLGDFFDKAELNAEEITALKEIQWFAGQHEIIVGNHELGNSNLDYSTAHLLQLLPNFKVINKPTLDIGFGYEILYLPYIMERDRKKIHQYINDETAGCFVTQEVKRRLILSHNDLKGVNYGFFESKEGFELDDIEHSCDFFINGHIHNGQNISNKIINIGNITGQNFNENGDQYNHHIIIFDTKTFELKCIENPYAYNFYKLEINNQSDFDKVLRKNRFKPHSVVSIKCIEYLVNDLKSILESDPNVEEYRVVTIVEDKVIDEAEAQPTLTSIDHLKQFQDYILENVGNTEYVNKELQEVLK